MVNTEKTTLLRCRDCGAEMSDEDTIPLAIQPGADVERCCPKCHSDYWVRLFEHDEVI